MTRLQARSRAPQRPGFDRQNLEVGLHTITEFNQSIRYADAKAGTLAAVQALTLTLLTGRPGTEAGVSGLLASIAVLGVLVSAALLLAGQIPRLTARDPGAGPNRLAFPSHATMSQADVQATPPIAVQQENVWRQATELASIAVVKYRWLRRTMISTFVTLAVVLVRLGLAAWIS